MPLERIPYAVDLALEMLKPFRHIITVNTGEPVAFFAYPNKPSQLKPAGCDVFELCRNDEDCLQALADLADAVDARPRDQIVQTAKYKSRPTGALSSLSIAHALLATIPEGCILIDESVSTGRESFGVTAAAAPHDTLQNMGGSIGFSPPVSVGAAIACPNRPVLCVVGDGSAMYTLQALWTQAREGLNVATVVFANKKYRILHNEFRHVGAGKPGPNALSMLDIDRPALDWVALAKGMGVSATSVVTAEDLCQAIEFGVSESGPYLIEARL